MMGDSGEKGDRVAELENGSDRDLSPGHTKEKDGGVAHVSRIPIPEILQKYTKEERDQLELKLKRKIDLRLMPAIIIMYILNYIDRYVRRIFHGISSGSHDPLLTATAAITSLLPNWVAYTKTYT